MAEAYLPPVPADPYVWPFDGRWSAADTAVLLLGFQAGPVERLRAAAQAARAARLAAAARRAGLAVFAARRGVRPGAAPVLARRAPLGDAVPEAGSPGWALVPAAEPGPDGQIFDHGGDNAFHGTGLEAVLRRAGIRNLLIAGLPTDGLVHASMRAANDMGFECLAVADACKGTSLSRHKAQLRITTFGNGLFGAVAPLAAVLTALPHRDAASPHRESET